MVFECLAVDGAPGGVVRGIRSRRCVAWRRGFPSPVCCVARAGPGAWVRAQRPRSGERAPALRSGWCGSDAGRPRNGILRNGAGCRCIRDEVLAACAKEAPTNSPSVTVTEQVVPEPVGTRIQQTSPTGWYRAVARANAQARSGGSHDHRQATPRRRPAAAQLPHPDARPAPPCTKPAGGRLPPRTQQPCSPSPPPSLGPAWHSSAVGD
jgi:hypothetical protein